MNLGLITKTLREILPATVLAAVGLAAFEALVSYVFWSYQRELTQELIQIDFVRDLIQSLVGANYDAPIGPESLMSLAWVHPLVLALVFAHAITICTRVPAGEVDRGNWVHNLEHGHVVLLYSCPEGCDAELAVLREVLAARPAVSFVLTPDTELPVPRFAAVTWTWILRTDAPDLATLLCFVDQHAGHAPEGAAN